MAQTMVYTCDICKQSKSEDDLAKITVKSEGIKMRSWYNGIRIDICPDCLKSKGFVVEVKDKSELKQIQERNKATLENKIFDILSDMGVMFEKQ